MVNTFAEKSTRARIIEILRNSSNPVSGEMIAGMLGISRVAVWKSIKSLNGNGYSIGSSSLGYRLLEDLNSGLFPWEFGKDESRFRHLEKTDSTMNRAREEALAGGADGLVITAEAQLKGRGTGAKKWESATGGLFFTLLTRPAINAAYSCRQVVRAQCAMARSIKELAGIEATILWPNDIFTEQGKIGGILCETLSSGNTVLYSNLGIGINTGNKPETKGTASVEVNRKDLLRYFLREFEKMDCESAELVSLWNSLSPLTGKTVNYCKNAGGPVTKGIFRGIDTAGWAMIDSLETGNNTSTNHYPPGSATLFNKGKNK